MKGFATFAAFAAGANAFVPRSNSCCFHIQASGEVSGTVGQLGDGQNRIGGGLPQTQFCIDSNGGITDSSGRGCVVTEPTTQFQCDLGATPVPGFSVDSNGQLAFNGDTNFVACETGELDERNIYTTESSDVTNCKMVKLNADSCSGSGSPSGAVPAPSTPTAQPVPGSPAPVSHPTTNTEATPTACSTETGTVPPPVPGQPGTPGVPQAPGPSPGPAQPATPGVPQQPGTSGVPQTPGPSPAPGPGQPGAPGVPSAPGPSPPAPGTPGVPPAGGPSPPAGAGCPTDLSGDHEFPHLIIPIDSSSPDSAPGTSFNGTVSPTVSSIFNFDIPASDAGKTCSLVFLFPRHEDLITSSFTFSGDGKVKFESLVSHATKATSFSNAPAVMQDFGEFTVAPGNSYRISTFACPAGQTVGYEMSNAGTTSLDFFQDFNPPPIGLFITVC